MKVSVTKIFDFAASHQLIGTTHDGKIVIKPDEYYGMCGTGRNFKKWGKMPHGHTYKLEVTITGKTEDLKEDGMLINFTDLKKMVNDSIVNEFDHTFLNKSFKPIFDKSEELDNMMYVTTAEVMAIGIKSTINKLIKIKNKNLSCSKVVLWETPRSFATVED